MKFKKPLSLWSIRVLIALDQLLNAILCGDQDETVSSRLGKLKLRHGGSIPWSHPLARAADAILEVLDPGHTIDAIEWDEGEQDLSERTMLIAALQCFAASDAFIDSLAQLFPYTSWPDAPLDRLPEQIAARIITGLACESNPAGYCPGCSRCNDNLPLFHKLRAVVNGRKNTAANRH